MSVAQMDSVGRGIADTPPASPAPGQRRESNASAGKKVKNTPPPSPPPGVVGSPSAASAAMVSSLEMEGGRVVEEGRPVIFSADAGELNEGAIAVGVTMDDKCDDEDDENVRDVIDKLDKMDVDPRGEESDDDTAELLLGSSAGGDEEDAVPRRRSSGGRGDRLGCCRKPYRIGSMMVLFPAAYERNGMGMMGPHFLGPAFSLCLLLFASNYYIGQAGEIGVVSQLICIGFAVVSVVALMFVSCSDPGIITRAGQQRESGGQSYAGLPRDGRDLSDWRYCDLCSVYQPPKAAHCPDCCVCVDGFDHHCVWMGTCIGKRNFRAFVIFNFSWLCYLLYSLVWLTALGPVMYKG